MDDKIYICPKCKSQGIYKRTIESVNCRQWQPLAEAEYECHNCGFNSDTLDEFEIRSKERGR